MRYNVTSIILHPSQWNMCTKICQLLKVFNDATNTLFDIYYPTTNLFMIETLNIVIAFYDCIFQGEDLKSYMSRPDPEGRHVTTTAWPWIGPSFPKPIQDLARLTRYHNLIAKQGFQPPKYNMNKPLK